MFEGAPILQVPAGWGVAVFAFAALWAVQRRTRDATSVDLAWALAIGCLAVWYAASSTAEPSRRVLVGGLALLWSGRLAWHLWRDRLRTHKAEDGRYRALREHWGAHAQRNFFFFYQGQAFVAVLFSLPFWAAMGRPGAIGALDVAGLLVAVVAVVGEAVADAQLARWRADPGNRGRTCRAGLWRYSRHPNYFFEWVHWWAYVLIGFGAPHGWMTLLGPVFMLLFLFKLTGIPYTEQQALKSRGDDYRDYQRTTSVFVPWFPKKEAR